MGIVAGFNALFISEPSNCFMDIFNLCRRRKVIRDPMKYLVVGLGNIGPEYVHTRHNIGFDVLDVFSEELGASFQSERYGYLARVKARGRRILLLKPSTYMNRSGKAVKYWMDREKINKENVLIIVDDLNLDLGRIRIRGRGSDGGHNGLRDIIQYLGQDFARMRIGIGNNFYPGQQSDFVLGKWSKEEEDQLSEIFVKTSKAIISFATIGVNRTMNQFNN